MMPDDQLTIVCVRTDSPGYVVPGSTRGHACARCGLEVWLAPSSTEHLKAEPDALIICFHCLELGELTSGNVEPLNPLQQREFKQYLEKD